MSERTTRDSRPTSLLVEACVDGVPSALAAEAGGAARLELCSALSEGGLTPSAGVIEMVRERVALPLFVLIRPRGGDFLYDAEEFEVMRRDVVTAGLLGADGVVLGVLQSNGTVDAERTGALIEAARPLDVTFHRAFDFTRDADEALDRLIALGADRVLTSGHAASAIDGVATLARLVERAAGRIGVVAGGGVRPDNVRAVIQGSGVTEVHLRGGGARRSGMEFRREALALNKPQETGEYEWIETMESVIRETIAAAGT
jgi:copper homeostasis protein